MLEENRFNGAAAARSRPALRVLKVPANGQIAMSRFSGKVSTRFEGTESHSCKLLRDINTGGKVSTRFEGTESTRLGASPLRRRVGGKVSTRCEGTESTRPTLARYPQ